MTIYAPFAFPLLFPIGIANPRLTDFIKLSGDRMSRETVVRSELVMVMLEVVRVLAVMGSTIGFGIKEHVRTKQVALGQDVVLDTFERHWRCLPGNMKPMRTSWLFVILQATCQATARSRARG